MTRSPHDSLGAMRASGRDLVRSLRASAFGRDAGVLAVALALQNASNYGFNVVVSRLLGPGDYGELSSLLAALIVLSVPFGVVQTIVAKRAATIAKHAEDEAAALVAGTSKVLLPLGLLGTVVLLALSPLIATFLSAGTGAVALLAPYICLGLLGSVPTGVIQGRLRFRALGAVTVAGAVVRLVVGITLVRLGLGVAGAVLGSVLGQVLMLVLLWSLTLRGRGWTRAARTLAPLRGELRRALVALGSLALLAELDILLARHYLPRAASGYYASAGLLARMLLFLPGAIAIVALPRFAAARARPGQALEELRKALWATTALVLCAYVGLVGLRHLAVTLAFGRAFAPAAGLLPVLALGGGLLALVSVLVYYHIALGTRADLFVLGGVLAEAVAIALFHASGMEIGVAFVLCTGLVAALQLHAALAATHWSGSAGAPLPRPPANGPELSVVLPCHNAASALPPFVAAIRRELAGSSYELVVASDGSTDGTERVAAALGDGITVVHYPAQAGKGQALRAGLASCTGRYVAFIDGDGDISASALRPFVELMRLYEPDIVLGSKRHPLSELHYPPLRRLMSWGYQRFEHALFRINVRDTQTGLKLIRRDVLEAVLPRMLEKRYAFDLELLVVARMLGYRRIFEAPIKIEYRFSSNVNARATARIVLDTLAIFYRRYILATYGTPQRAQQRERATSAGLDAGLRMLFINWRDIQNPDAGGAEAWTHEVARRWVAQGHSVKLLTSGFAGGARHASIDGVQVERRGRLRAGTFHLLVQLRLARLRDVDVVIDEINTIPFFTPLWRSRLPTTVALIHQLAVDVWDAEVPRPLAALGRWLEPRMLRLYRRTPVVAVSESTRADLQALGLSNVRVVPGGRDEAPVVASAEREPAPTFLFVGRLAANKRPDHAVEAFRQIRTELPDARLWLIGRGPLEPSLRGTLPDGAALLGYVSRGELYERMARADCLLVPSVREGWGLVVIEAASVGTPAVGYDVPGIRDSIRAGETGLLVTNGDPVALGVQAARLVCDAPTLLAMSRATREWAGSFSWETTASELAAILRQECAPVPADVSHLHPVEAI